MIDMSTMSDEQENNTPELTNLIDVVVAETTNGIEANAETDVDAEIKAEAEVAVEEKVEVKVEVEAKAEGIQEEETATTKEIEEVATPFLAETAVFDDDEPVAPKPIKVQKPHKQQRPQPKSTVTSRDIKRWFATCGRCGFFLSAYQMIESAIDLETAVSYTKGRWLTLDWDYEIRNLVNKSYGCNPDTGIYHLDGICPECRRRFIYHAGRHKSTFRIALHPAIKR